MQVHITTLSENTANYGLLAEWGLSILVEVNSARILVDTGFSFSAAHNAPLLGVDLSTIDWIVLSHGHGDHTGGLREVLTRRGQVEVVGHPELWAAKYARREKEGERYAGIPFQREVLESLGARFRMSQEPVKLLERVVTTGEIPMTTPYEQVEKNLLVRDGDSLRQDPLADDLALVIDTDFGLVVVLGCAHRGMVNTLRHAQKLTGNDGVYAVIGGTHLFRASRERVEETILDLRKMGVQKLAVSHCTGFRASARLAQEFGDSFILNNAGTRITLPQ